MTYYDWLQLQQDDEPVSNFAVLRRSVTVRPELSFSQRDIGGDEYSRECYAELMRRTQRMITNGDAPRWTS